MPHATDTMDAQDAQDAQDELLIQQALDPQTTFDFNRELEPGEKADDAVNYEDLSDDSLAEEEDKLSHNDSAPQRQGPLYESLDDLRNEDGLQVTEENGVFGDEYDDLFGDTPLSPTEIIDRAPEEPGSTLFPQLDSFEPEPPDTQNGYHQPLSGQNLANGHKAEINQPHPLQALNAQTVSKEEQMQQYLISMSSQGAATHDSLLRVTLEKDSTQDLATLWPKFERDSVPRFMDLLPLKRSYYAGKQPLKQPKPVYPTKLNLDLAQDQEKQFRLSSTPRRKLDADDERHGVVKISLVQPTEDDREEDGGFLSDSENETVGGVTWQDLQIVCEDWDYQSSIASSKSGSDHSPEGLRHRDHDGNHCISTDDLWDMPLAKVSSELKVSPLLLSIL